MVKKLQKKIIIILTILLWIMLLSAILIINIFDYISIKKDFQSMRRTAEQNVRRIYRGLADEETIEKLSEETKEFKDVYAVVVDQNGKVVFSLYSDKKTQDIKEVISYILKDRETKNFIERAVEFHENKDTIYMGDENFIMGNKQRMVYKIKVLKSGIVVSFFQNKSIYNEMKYIILISIVVLIIGMIVIFILAVIISISITRPVAESYNKQKRFIADASHELKTPLTVIGVNIDMLRKGNNPEKYISYIQSESVKMNQLLDELLMLASADYEQNNITMAKNNLSEIVDGAIAPFEALAYENGVHLNMDIAENIYFVCDETKMQRLVGVLVDNAIKHADFEKTVEVRLKKEKRSIELSVMNTGKEIDKAEQDKIFERFYRIDKSRNRKAGRYGLGLSIAKTIAEYHKGKISVHSSDGKTVFLIKFMI